jgi:hypothetical protein
MKNVVVAGAGEFDRNRKNIKMLVQLNTPAKISTIPSGGSRMVLLDHCHCRLVPECLTKFDLSFLTNSIATQPDRGANERKAERL